jgi:hypothetical protein
MKHHLSLLAFLAIAATAHGQYIVLTCDKPVQMSNDHVGHEWRFGFGVNKTFYPVFEPVEAPTGSASTLEFIVQELDEQTDQTIIPLEIDPMKLELNKQYSKKLEVVVTENAGRFKGHKAMFNVTVYYKKIATRT